MPISSTLEAGESVKIDDPRLFNMNDLATALGVHRGYVRRMKVCGFKMPGGRASVASAHAWLTENPDLMDKK